MTVGLDEQLISLKQAASRLPGRPHISTLHRWRSRGSGGVKLGVVKIGGRVFTSVEELERFIQARTAASSHDRSPERQTSKQRQKQIEAAEHQLARAGITTPGGTNRVGRA